MSNDALSANRPGPREGDDPSETTDHKRLATVGLLLGLAAGLAAGACLAMGLLWGQPHVDVILYVAGLAAACGIACGIVAFLRHRPALHRSLILTDLVVSGAALGLAVWAYGMVRARMDLEARQEVIEQILAAARRHVEQTRLAPKGLEQLDGLPEGLLDNLPAGLEPKDYEFAELQELTVDQLRAHAGDRNIILVHDGGAGGRGRAVLGRLDGQIAVERWSRLRVALEEQRAWALRLRRELRPAQSRPATTREAATQAATRPTTSRPASGPATRPAVIRRQVPGHGPASRPNAP
jgi:hypothetical protein